MRLKEIIRLGGTRSSEDFGGFPSEDELRRFQEELEKPLVLPQDLSGALDKMKQAAKGTDLAAIESAVDDFFQLLTSQYGLTFYQEQVSWRGFLHSSTNCNSTSFL